VSALDFFFSSQRIRAPLLSSRPYDHGALLDNGALPPSGIDGPSCSGWDLESLPASQPEVNLTPATLFNTQNENQLMFDGPGEVEFVHQNFGSGGPPVPFEGHNGTVVPSSIQLSSMETFPQANPSDGVPLVPLNTNEAKQVSDENLRQFTDKEYLANLPPSVLKELSVTVAEALIIANQNAGKKSLETQDESVAEASPVTTIGNTATQSRTVKGVLKCEYPGCNTTFRRKKDRLRHVREKHATDVLKCEYPGCNTTFRRKKDRLRHARGKHATVVKVLSCPVVDCPMGFGHKFHRADKLRDHLRGEKISSYQWTCVIPGCSEIVATRVGLIDHLGQHDYQARTASSDLFRVYGLTACHDGEYLDRRYICSIQGCPFGTDHEATMSSHMSIPHDGPFCPCPIPNCGAIFHDWLSVSEHLAREHNYISRKRFNEEIRNHSLHYWQAIFVCPICHNKITGFYGQKVEDHCQKHERQQLLQFSNELLDTWTFSLGPTMGLYLATYQIHTLTANKLFAYVVLSAEELLKLHNEADLEQAGAKMRAATELLKDVD
jgi:uncharacterized C2H2 Zn-finger protein